MKCRFVGITFRWVSDWLGSGRIGIHISWDYVILDPNSLNWFTLGFRLVEIGLFCDQIIGLGYFEIKICKDWILL